METESKSNSKFKIPLISKLKNTVFLKWLFIVIAIFLIGVLSDHFYFKQTLNNITKQQQDKHVVFLFEVYDKIKENYWDNITDQQLIELYRLGTEKLTGFPQRLESSNKEQLKNMITKAMKNMNDRKKKEFTVNLANVVLANLNPYGRSGLYTQKDEENLKNKVNNIDPTADLYKDLGVGKEATSGEIKKTYETQSQKLNEVAKDKTQPEEKRQEAQTQITQINKAYETLAVPDRKENYDKTGTQSTANVKLIGSNIFYVKIKELSPATFNEFQSSLETIKDKPADLDTLIIDLRGNIGGAIDLTPYFIGAFIGNNQYAFDFFHKGEYNPFKTQIGMLPTLSRFKKIVVLIDNQTQSSAEIMAATFKKYHLAVVVGTTSKGWGTVERVFALDNQIDPKEKYSMFLVHSLTLREDNQPIEGKGVDPNVNTKDLDWKKQFNSYLNYPQLADSVEGILSGK
ncbi:MAG: S41 family peptidase [bacterium]|nr:S41 family peptidase [bacterium]